MEKKINIILQGIGYFIIVIVIFWIFKKIGLGFEDSSILVMAIGSTICWNIVKLIKFFSNKNKVKDS